MICPVSLVPKPIPFFLVFSTFLLYRPALATQSYANIPWIFHKYVLFLYVFYTIFSAWKSVTLPFLTAEILLLSFMNSSLNSSSQTRSYNSLNAHCNFTYIFVKGLIKFSQKLQWSFCSCIRRDLYGIRLSLTLILVLNFHVFMLHKWFYIQSLLINLFSYRKEKKCLLAYYTFFKVVTIKWTNIC